MELIDNKYQVLRTLGKGGCGIVYVCWDEALNREVAVKVLHDQMHDNISLARFRNEAQSLSLCKHPCIVQCLNFGISPQGHPYFVMDYVPGVTLAEELKQNGPLSPSRFLGIFQDVLSALECAHEAGLVHRDLKPSNILITTSSGNERAILIDFGLTKQLDGQKLTATTALLGTPQYMSPEQCKGSVVDIRSDLYSIGCTMYEAATGHAIFKGEAMEVLLAHLHAEPEDIPTVLDPLLSRLLDKDRSKRFSTAAEAATCMADLNLANTEHFQRTKGKQPRRESKQPTRQNLLPKLGISATIIFLLLVGALSLRSYFEGQRPREPTAQELRVANEEYVALLTGALEQLQRKDYPAALRSCDAALAVLGRVQLTTSPKLPRILALKLQLQRRLGSQTAKDLPLATQAIAIAKAAKQTPEELTLSIETARLLAKDQQFTAADERYNQALNLMQLNYNRHPPAWDSMDWDNAQVLIEYGQLTEFCGSDPEKTANIALIACERLEKCRQHGASYWAPELEANHLVIRTSKNKAQLLECRHRMQNAGKDTKNLNSESRSIALVAAGMAACLSGERTDARNLMLAAKELNQREDKAPYNGACHAIHALLGADLITDPKQKMELARFAYDQYRPLRRKLFDPFAVSAVYLAHSLKDSGQYNAAMEIYQEAAEAAEQAAKLSFANHDQIKGDSLYLMSGAAYTDCLHCCVVAGDHAGAEKAKVKCRAMLDKVTLKSAKTYKDAVEIFNQESAAYRKHFTH